MKKTIKNIYAAGICLLLLASACKKNELPTNTIKQEVAVTEQQTARAGNSARSSSGELPGAPNAIVDISEPLFNALRAGRLIQMQPVSQGLFKAIDIIDVPIDIDPCAGAWAAYDAYMAANIAAFQAWANANCKPFRGGWSHPCGLCILFAVYPTQYWNCPQDAYEYNQYLPLHTASE